MNQPDPRWWESLRLSVRTFNTLLYHYSRDASGAWMNGEMIPSREQVIEDLRAGRISPRIQRNYGKTSHAELCRELGIEVVRIQPMRPEWNFNPFTGQPINRQP